MMTTEVDDATATAAGGGAAGGGPASSPSSSAGGVEPQQKTRTTSEQTAVAVAAEQDLPPATALQDLIAGGIAGSASVVVGHPFDTYKVRLQTSPSSSASGGKAAASSKQFGGMTSLFRGMTAPLATAAVVNAMIFSAFGESSRYWDENFGDEAGAGAGVEEGGGLQRRQTQRGNHPENAPAWRGTFDTDHHLGEKHHHHGHDYAKDNAHMHAEGHLTHCELEDSASDTNTNLTKSLACGSFAGLVQCLVICPMEHIKCRLQVQHGVGAADHLYRGPLDAVSKIISGHGLTGLYRGWWCTTVREVPAFGLYFATYDDIKDRINRMFEENGNESDDGQPYVPHHSHTWAASAVAGGISGSFTWAIIYPVDVIKSRIQTAPLDCSPAKRSMWTVGRDIVRENGWRYMFRGLGVTLARAFPVNGIIFPVYEFTLMKLTQAGIGGGNKGSGC